jgi:transketolase
MPCREWFDEQDDAYRESVIPATVRARVSIEAGVTGIWRDIVGDAGRIISINHYGASAAAPLLFEQFGFTAASVAAGARDSLQAATRDGAPPQRAASGPTTTADLQNSLGDTVA